MFQGEGLQTETIRSIPVKSKYRSVQKSLNYYKNRCLKLKLENEKLKKQSFLDFNVDVIFKSRPTMAKFFKAQVKQSDRKKKGRRWSN